MPDLDLLEYAAADHQNLRSSLGEPQFAFDLETHLTMERALVYPLVEHELPSGRRVADGLRELDRALVDSVLGGGPGTSGARVTRAALEAHISQQEACFHALRKAVPAERLLELGREVPVVVEQAPSRLHPRLPDRGPLRELASELAAEVDRFADRP